VPVHEGDRAHVCAERIEQRLGREVAVRGHRQRHHVVAPAREQRIGAQQGGMVAGGHQDATRGPRGGAANDAEVVGFAATLT
jgi:hypothetical protein